MAVSAQRHASLPQPTPGTPPFPAVPRPERFSLENGLRIVAVHRPAFPQLAVRLVIPAGSVADPGNAPGAASLVAGLITEGTESLQGLELHERIDSLGASLAARAGHDFTEIDLGLLAETLAPGLALLGEVVIRPAFPEKEFERVRAESLDALEARLDEPANVADDCTGEAVFGAGHPYARLPLGTIDGVEALRRESLIAYHARHYRPVGSILVIAGDLSGVNLRGVLEETLGAWSGATPPVEYPADPVAAASASDQIINVAMGEGAQGEIRVAGLGMSRSSPDWVPAIVANYVLGGSTITGRLGANLREEKGWTYGVRSGFSAGLRRAGWTVETAVDAEATSAAIREIEKELRRMVDEPVGEDELERTREALVLSLPRAFETPSRIVSRLAMVEAFGLEPDYWTNFPDRVRQTTAEQVQEMSARYFDPSGLARIAVGPSLTDGATK